MLAIFNEKSVKIDFKETLVENNEVAKEVKFRGSPTLLVNGNEFEGMPVPDKPAMTCRYYPNGLPTKKRIKERINALIL